MADEDIWRQLDEALSCRGMAFSLPPEKIARVLDSLVDSYEREANRLYAQLLTPAGE